MQSQLCLKWWLREGNYHLFLQQGPNSLMFPFQVKLTPGLHFTQMQSVCLVVRLTIEGKLTLKLDTRH